METYNIHPSFINVTSQRFANLAKQSFNNVTNQKSFCIDLILDELKRVYDLRDIRLYEENKMVLNALAIITDMKKSGQRQIILGPDLDMAQQIIEFAGDEQDVISKDLFKHGFIRPLGQF